MRTIVYLNPKIVKEARDLGLHISIIANDCLKEAVKKIKGSPGDFPERWMLKPRKELETEWRCYYCGTSFGATGRLEGAKLGKCPTCGAEQVGPGVTIITKEAKAYLRKLEQRLKDQEKLRSASS
jgi:ribosomal protein L37AE/L43A